MIILNNYSENLGKRNLINVVLIDLKREIKEHTVFVMKAKTYILKVLRKRSFFNDDTGVKHPFGLSCPITVVLN